MATRIDASFIHQVVEHTDLVALINQQVHLKRSGKSFSACCPFHQEKTPSFTVNPDKQFYYCFGCGASGDALSFLIDYQRMDFMDALKQLAQGAGLTLPETSAEQASQLEQGQALITALTWIDDLYRQQLKTHPERNKAVQYLQNRGVSGLIAKEFHLGFAPPGWDFLAMQNFSTTFRNSLIQAGLLIERKNSDSYYDALRDRIIFPIRNQQGKVIAFGGRVLNDDKPKYLNSPESILFNKGQELYGLYEARQSSKLELLLVVEGYMDVIALHQHGFKCAVATLGTATSSTHIIKMFRLVDRICFCFDGDNAGRKAAWKAVLSCLPVLQEGKKISFIFLPDGEDPDTLIRQEGAARFAERLEHSESLSDFIFRHQSIGLNPESLEDKVVLIQNIRPLLADMPAGIYRDLLVQKLENISGLTGIEVPDRPKNTQTRERPPNQIRQQSVHPAMNSLADHALRFLLQYPDYAPQLNIISIRSGQPPRMDLLYELRATLMRYPDLHTAGILAHWHDSPEGEILTQLAAAESTVAAQNPDQILEVLNARMQLLVLEDQMHDTISALREHTDAQSQQQLLQQQVQLHQQITKQRRLLIQNTNNNS